MQRGAVYPLVASNSAHAPTRKGGIVSHSCVIGVILIVGIGSCSSCGQHCSLCQHLVVVVLNSLLSTSALEAAAAAVVIMLIIAIGSRHSHLYPKIPYYVGRLTVGLLEFIV